MLETVDVATARERRGMRLVLSAGVPGPWGEAARGLLIRRLQADVPSAAQTQRTWFEPYVERLQGGQRRHYESMAQNLKKTLVYNSGFSPMGLLRSCLDFALNDHTKLGGVFESVTAKFRVQGARDVLDTVEKIYAFRNTAVAHQETEITDAKQAERELISWIRGLNTLSKLQ